MIPKIIHYCWFGGKPLPDEVKKYMETWKKYCSREVGFHANVCRQIIYHFSLIASECISFLPRQKNKKVKYWIVYRPDIH